MTPNINVRNIAGLNIPEHDCVQEEYIGGVPSTDNARLTKVTFRRGGVSGTIVAVVDITYHGSTNNIATVLRTNP